MIVGAGSAGCILANRLSADPNVRVTLLEAGPPDSSMSIRMPAALGVNIARNTFNWGYHTIPQHHLDNRAIHTPRGKTLGGSSSINGIVYIRGHAADYDRWESEGATNWSYKNVLPYFKKVESFSTENEFRGSKGPVTVTTLPVTNKLDQAFLKAGQEAGFGATEDVNGAQQSGVGLFDMNVDAGVRASTAHAYLHPARHRPNLTVLIRAHACELLTERDGVVGVKYRQRGRMHEVRATEEVLLCGGAINTPQLLILSGIGPANELQDLGIHPVHDLPGVGKDLQDHLEIHLHFAAAKGTSLNAQMQPHRLIKNVGQWLGGKSGAAVSNGCTVGAFLNTQPEVPHPDVQIHFFPVYLEGWIPKPSPEGFRIGIGTLRATSRGSVTLASKDPFKPPLIDPNYLATTKDRQDMRRCIELGREIASQPAFHDLRGIEMDPGPDVLSDKDIDAYIRQHAASAYHVSCSCRMGLDVMSVVAPDTKVHGLTGLRIVDASIMPSITSGNLNAPVMMMAEKAADMILGNSPLA